MTCLRTYFKNTIHYNNSQLTLILNRLKFSPAFSWLVMYTDINLHLLVDDTYGTVLYGVLYVQWSVSVCNNSDYRYLTFSSGTTPDLISNQVLVQV